MEENAKIEAKRNALKAINENKSPSFATRLFAKKRNSKGPMTPNSLQSANSADSGDPTYENNIVNIASTRDGTERNPQTTSSHRANELDHLAVPEKSQKQAENKSVLL